MRHNDFLDLAPQISEEYLQQLEKKYSFIMPSMVKKHVLKYNGGYPEKNVFIGKDGERYSVAYFIPIKYEDYHLEKVLDLLRDNEIFPEWLIPFADDDGGNFFCYSLRNSEIGAIYYYSHEFDYGEDPENQGTYLSSSFDAFIDALEMDEEDDEYEDNEM